jgi:uncharacterized protein (DUF983 family)
MDGDGNSLGNVIRQAFACTCPRCGKAGLYTSRFGLNIRPACPACGLDFSRHDVGDGSVFFIMFALCILLPPLALLADHLFHPPMWAQMIIWTFLAIGLTMVAMRPLTALLIDIQYWQRPETFEKPRSDKSGS